MKLKIFRLGIKQGSTYTISYLAMATRGTHALTCALYTCLLLSKTR